MAEPDREARRTARARSRGARAGDGGVAVNLTRKDFQSDQEVRWCPGCGDYSILAAMQLLLRRSRRAAREPGLRVRASGARRASRTT